MEPEEELTQEEKKAAWDKGYHCLHWGDDRARPITVDQRQLIMLIHHLTKEDK